jgi:hypothetical protein
MTDIRTLLREGAGSAPGPVDLRVVAARAGRRRLWRRALVWITALGALVGAGIPVETVLAPAGHGRVHVATVYPPRPAEHHRDAAHPEQPAAPPPAGATSRLAPAPPPPAAGAPRAVTTSGTGLPTGGAPLPRTTPTGSAAPYATAYGCSLDSVGLVPGQSRQCGFTAITAGGWAYDNSAGDAGFDTPQATVSVTHAGATRTYASHHLTDCADAIIAPGDQVLLTLTAPSVDVTVTYRTGAGQAWSCSTPTTASAT